MNEIRHKREKLIVDFFFGEINEEDFKKEFDKLNEQQEEWISLQDKAGDLRRNDRRPAC